ncbi:uncharacterized protein LOC134242532 [Saccostrea cucullata]|uniref:uncharacterized protein LOC134242532 n=1 Tax=Saccostrea cuccullata TaxID=36930 RepID=UPI002ED02F8E
MDKIILALCLGAVLGVIMVSGQFHLGRPVVDSPEARAIFAAAERNRTPDGFLTKLELDDIFQTFDHNVDGIVDEQEFIYIWRSRHLGDISHAITLFHHADTDRDDVISKVPDLTRVFYYFDRDQDGKVSEEEFVEVWLSLSM